MANDKTSLILNVSRGVNSKAQKTISDISPDATSDELLNFAQKFAAMSTDTLEQVSRVERRTLEAEPLYKLLAPETIILQYLASEPQTAKATWWVALNETATQTPPSDGVEMSCTIPATFSGKIAVTGDIVNVTAQMSVAMFEAYMVVNEYITDSITINAVYDDTTYTAKTRIVGIKE